MTVRCFAWGTYLPTGLDARSRAKRLKVMSMPDASQLQVGYLIPEFPGQTHVWMWREIMHLREWGLHIRLYSTRRPPERDRARQGSRRRQRQKRYTCGRRAYRLSCGLPHGRLHPSAQVMALLADSADAAGIQGATAVAFMPAACVLAHDMERSGISHLHCHTCASGAVRRSWPSVSRASLIR